MQKDFWPNSNVAVLGAGAWGTALANLVARNCRDVRLWVKEEEQARKINGTRQNADFLPEIQLHERIHAMTSLERVFEGGVGAVIWALPSSVCRPVARQIAPHLTGEEVVLHATKGIEEGTLKRISVVLREELPCPRVGVISGPNLAHEVARGDPAATVVASVFKEVTEAGIALLMTDRFRIYSNSDVIGVEWAGTLKNTLAIASGAVDELKFGWNARAMLITRGLAEMVRFGKALGAKESTFLGLAGMGDLLATASSPLSRNYRVGRGLARGLKLDQVLAELGSTAEGVRTTEFVHKYAVEHGIYMPITTGVYQLLTGVLDVPGMVAHLMTQPPMAEA
jgi:glycerol-3-phosphate dehydrogenase (NAD(P)+)